MRLETLRRQLCGLLIIGLLFSGMCIMFVCADSTFPREISFSLAEKGRVICDVYTETLFGIEGESPQSYTGQCVSGTSHRAAYGLPVWKVLSDHFILMQEISKEAPLHIRRQENSAIGYIHRQDGKKG